MILGLHSLYQPPPAGWIIGFSVGLSVSKRCTADNTLQCARSAAFASRSPDVLADCLWSGFPRLTESAIVASPNLSFNVRKSLCNHIGEAAGNELADLIQDLQTRLEKVERTKVNVTPVVPGEQVEIVGVGQYTPQL